MWKFLCRIFSKFLLLKRIKTHWNKHCKLYAVFELKAFFFYFNFDIEMNLLHSCSIHYKLTHVLAQKCLNDKAKKREKKE